MGLLGSKVTDFVAKREGGSLLQPPKPGSRANMYHHFASILLIGQDHGLHDTGRGRGVLHTYLLS
jgi:hypothetical protein